MPDKITTEWLRDHAGPNPEGAAEYVGVSRYTAYRAVASGEWPSVRVGRRIVVPSAFLLSLAGHDPEAAA